MGTKRHDELKCTSYSESDGGVQVMIFSHDDGTVGVTISSDPVGYVSTSVRLTRDLAMWTASALAEATSREVKP